MMEDAEILTLVEGEEYGMERPSGLTIVDEIMFVTDNRTGVIFAFTLEGELIDQYHTDLGEGSLMGIYAASIDDLWIVDAVNNAVFRLQPESADTTVMPRTDEYTSL